MSWRLARAVLITDPLAILVFLLFAVTDWVGHRARLDPARRYRYGQFWSRLLLRVAGVRVEVSGASHLRPDGIYVLVANHRSLSDTPLLIGHLPVPFRFLAKQSLFRVPVIGGHLRRGGHIAVVRGDARSSRKALAESERVLAEASVLVFAEGTRGHGRLQSFKSGAAHLAIRGGAPLVPVAISGSAEVLPRGSVHLRAGRVRIAIGEPIATAGLRLQDEDRLTARLQEQVTALLGDPVPAPGD